MSAILKPGCDSFRLALYTTPQTDTLKDFLIFDFWIIKIKTNYGIRKFILRHTMLAVLANAKCAVDPLLHLIISTSCVINWGFSNIVSFFENSVLIIVPLHPIPDVYISVDGKWFGKPGGPPPPLCDRRSQRDRCYRSNETISCLVWNLWK